MGIHYFKTVLINYNGGLEYKIKILISTRNGPFEIG